MLDLLPADYLPPLIGGALIGLAAGLLRFGTGQIAGISGVLRIAMRGPERGWRFAFLAGLLIAGAGAAWRSGPQLAAGLSACIASADPWPPTLPDFRARCLGIPDGP